MIDDYCCVSARPGDGAEIASLFALVQRDHTLGLTIWSSSLASAFVEDIIAGGEPALRMKYYKVMAGVQIEGAICVRRIESRLFFDNVYVSPRLRRMQVSARFILDSTRSYLNDFDCQECAWDVWSHERALMSWYRQLGGIEQYRKNWFALRLRENSGPAGTALGRDEAERIHARYGFSTLDVATSQGRYRCGLIGRHAFRATDDRSVADPEFLATLASIDSERVVYVCSGRADLPGAGGVVATAIRMHSPIERFLQGLERQVPRHEALR